MGNKYNQKYFSEEERIAARKKYLQSEKFKKIHNEAQKKWCAKKIDYYKDYYKEVGCFVVKANREYINEKRRSPKYKKTRSIYKKKKIKRRCGFQTVRNLKKLSL